MARRLPVTLLAAALGLGLLVSGGRSQSLTAPASSPILAPATNSAERAPPPDAPKRTRAISSDVAAALAAVTPKYTPPPPKPEPKPESELVDMREVDKPKNTIVRLPKYIVQEPKPPVFRERDIHTQKGLTDIALGRYISEVDHVLNRFTLPWFGISREKRARAMYEEDERLKNMADLNDAAAGAARADPASGAYIFKESQQTFLRSADFGWSSGEPR